MLDRSLYRVMGKGDFGAKRELGFVGFVKKI